MKRALTVAAVLILAGCGTTGTNARWYNPTTWFSGSEGRAVDKAEKKEEKAQQTVERKEDAAIHAATVEVLKASVSAQSLPKSRPSEITTRFISNGMSLLQQVSPLTATENMDAISVVQGLLSEEAAKREAAEAKQAQAESNLTRVSNELTASRAALASAQADLAAKEDALRKAFDRENALANKYRNVVFGCYALIGVAVLLAGVSLYLRIGLGSVGAALHGLPSLIGADNAAKVVSNLDGATDWLHQGLIAAGKAKAHQLEAKAKAIIGG
jgi:hypothetical protein